MTENNVQTVFTEYLAIIHRLRRECPWDSAQTHESLRPHLVEEAYEVVDAIAENKPDHLRNELGDLFLHIALQTEIAQEENAFTMADVLSHSMEKMIRRHPHIFGDTPASREEEVKKNWETIKRQEGKTSVLDGVPDSLPALIRAQRTQEKASSIGFDWSDKKDVWKKVEEELGELRLAERAHDTANVEQEFGDLLFALVNYARFLRLDAEFALRRSVDKFGKRFEFIETELRLAGKTPSQSTLEEMDALWEKAKQRVG